MENVEGCQHLYFQFVWDLSQGEVGGNIWWKSPWLTVRDSGFCVDNATDPGVPKCWSCKSSNLTDDPSCHGNAN